MTSIRTESVPVVCLWLVQDGKILVVQRGPDTSQPGKWEFPGGKVEAGESTGAAIRREILEELGIAVQPVVTMKGIEHAYPHIRINLIPVYCTWEEGELILHEHSALKWVSWDDLNLLDLAAADAMLTKQHEVTLSGLLRQSGF